MSDSKTRLASCRLHKNILFLRKIRISLKYRPEIFKLILKMRQSLKRNKCLINKLKHQLCKLLRKIKPEEYEICSRATENVRDEKLQDANLPENHTQVGNVRLEKEKGTKFSSKNAQQSAFLSSPQLDEHNLIEKREKKNQTEEIIIVNKELTEMCADIEEEKNPVSRVALSEQDSNHTVDKKNNDSKLRINVGSELNDPIMKGTKDSLSQTKNSMISDVNNPILKDTKDSSFQASEEMLSLKFFDDSLDQNCDKKINISDFNDPVLKETKNSSSQTSGEMLSLKLSDDSLDQNSYKKLIRSDFNDPILKQTKDSSSQTSEELLSLKSSDDSINQKCDKKPDAWNIDKNAGEEKSIAEQVKEVAQSALQETGMVYVESAGMYYDYKTGYYYNSELGLYYHTDTGCYYYYSDEKKSFVFHSYPDRGTISGDNTNAACRKRPKKIKKASKADSAIDNLTKNFSQDTEDSNEGSKAKRRKKSSKKKVAKGTLNSDIQNAVDGTKVSKTEQVQNDSEGKDLKSEISEDNINIKDVIIEEKTKSISDELEDGECSETGSENSEYESTCSTETNSDDDTVAKHHPPSMRVIVRETNIPKLKIGSLFLVTKDGGTLGREGEQHAILIRDSSVSRSHLDIRYDMDRQIYIITDLGSKNGTVLNGIRMSESQVTSEPMEVVHGSTIQLGETKLLCHIHPGNDTCGHCEPGLIMEMQDIEKKVAYTRTCSVKKQHKLELARLKNMYAPQMLSIEAGTYNDRAKTRREVVGSSHDAEKTQSADLDTSIAPENKGFKLLEKMGWSKGEGLGKDSQGDTEPIPLVANEGKSGLGTQGASTTPGPVPFVRRSKLGPATLRLANKTKMLQPPAKAFQNTLDEDDDEE